MRFRVALTLLVVAWVIVAAIESARGDDPTIWKAPKYPAIKLPERISGEVGKPIAITADANGPYVRWLCQDDPKALRAAGDKGVIATFSKPGNYRVWGWTALENRPSSAAFTYVVVRPADPSPEPTPPPDPGPGPGPSPPEPIPPAPPDIVDPWAAELKKAFDGDLGSPADKAKWVGALGGFYAAMAEHVRKPAVKTVGDLLADYRAAQPSLLPDGSLMNVRRACGAKVAEVGATDPEATLSDDLRSKFANVFTRLALSLEVVK